MSYCTPCPPCDTNFPLLCEPLETTANGKRLVVEDSAACQKTIQSPVAQQVLKTDGAGNLVWTSGDNDKVLTKDSTGKVEFSQVTTNQITDSSVTTAKIADLSVTTAKLADNSVTSAKIVDGTIVNADINASAAIDGTKVNPQFGSQNISTTGNLEVGSLSDTTSTKSIRVSQGNTASVHPLVLISQFAQKEWAIALVQGDLLFCKDPVDYSTASLLASSKFTLDQNDRVGIGTNAPSTKLQIEGDISVNSATTATTVGAAGGASALPATPLGYLVFSINGFARKIPYYNV